MNQKPLFLAVALIALLVIGGVFWMMQNRTVIQTTVSDDETNPVVEKDEDTAPLEPSKDYAIRPDFSKVKDFKNTLTLQKGVSVKYGNGWAGKKTGDGEFVSGRLTKTVNGRSYMIGFQENEKEFLAADGAYANNSLKVYSEVQINEKPHFVITSSPEMINGERVDYGYISSCSVKINEACSLPLDENFLFIMLRQSVPNAQAPVPLDFNRIDDQQILAEFAEVLSTLKY